MNKTIFCAVLLILGGCQSPAYRQITVTPVGETAAVNSEGDAADDPAVWIHPQDHARSLILGTQKKQGLYSFDLSGQQVQFIPAGRLNNVDVRQDVTTPHGVMDIAAASNRSSNQVSLFTLDRASGHIEPLKDIAVNRSDLQEVYGFCMGQVKPGELIFVVTGKDANAEIYWLNWAEKNLQKVRTLNIATQSEGCVIDDANGDIFIGEEGYGIWRFNYFDTGLKQSLVQVEHAALRADVEGLALVRHGGRRYLLISSQGNSTYPLLDLQDYTIPLVVRIGRTEGLDKVTGTDGIDVSQALHTAQYPEGIFIAQDDKNTAPRANQNYKLVSLKDVLDALDQQP